MAASHMVSAGLTASCMNAAIGEVSFSRYQRLAMTIVDYFPRRMSTYYVKIYLNFLNIYK
jgi:hypothetical protein